MEPSRDRVVEICRALAHEIRVERITFMAGSIAYNAFVSLLPLLLLVLAVVSTLGNGGLEGGVIDLVQAVLTPGASEVLLGELERANATTGVSVLGATLLIWGTLRIFRGLDTAFSDIYESGAQNTFTDQIIDGVIVLFAVGVAVLVGVLVETRLGGLDGLPGGWLVQRLALMLGLAGALLPMYYIFPDEDDMQLREAVPGVVFTATGLMVFQSLFGLYIEFSSRSPRKSVLAGILVFLTWLYFSGLVILLGAAINAVLTNRSADVNIEPVVGGIRPAETATVEGEDIDSTLRSLEHALNDAEELTVTVDGTDVTLPVPESARAELVSSPFPFVEDRPELHLSWERTDGEE